MDKFGLIHWLSDRVCLRVGASCVVSIPKKYKREPTGGFLSAPFINENPEFHPPSKLPSLDECFKKA